MYQQWLEGEKFSDCDMYIQFGIKLAKILIGISNIVLEILEIEKEPKPHEWMINPPKYGFGINSIYGWRAKYLIVILLDPALAGFFLLQPILKYWKWVLFSKGMDLTYPGGLCYWHHWENVLQDIFVPIQLTRNNNVQKILLRLSFWIFLRQFHDDHTWRKCS